VPDGNRPTFIFGTFQSIYGMNAKPAKWYYELTRYHWFVLIVAALGWLFDTMDQQLFTLARAPAMNELLAPAPGAYTAILTASNAGGRSKPVTLRFVVAS